MGRAPTPSEHLMDLVRMADSSSATSRAPTEDRRRSPAPRCYIDVSPMQEFEFTGIPQVVAKLCEEALGDPRVEPCFFYNRYEVPRWLVEHLLVARSGSMLRWAFARYVMGEPLVKPASSQSVWGLHTNIKFARRLFPIEGQIIHDLTTLVTPEHHTADANVYHQTKFLGDLMTNDITFTVSRSTAEDVLNFYPEVADRPLVVSHLGVDWTHIPAEVRERELRTEPYIFVLGTLEPRKNVGIVLDLLQRDPKLADGHRVVFGGRVGWGDAFERQLERRGLSALAENGRIVQTGFITEIVKYRLLKHASAVVYPSLYEGFGLPLAEAISLGAPAVTTASSSLPEVGRGFARYFDPDSLDSFADALQAAIDGGPMLVSRTGETLEAWRDYFSWSRCWSQIRDAFFRVDVESWTPELAAV